MSRSRFISRHIVLIKRRSCGFGTKGEQNSSYGCQLHSFAAFLVLPESSSFLPRYSARLESFDNDHTIRNLVVINLAPRITTISLHTLHTWYDGAHTHKKRRQFKFGLLSIGLVSHVIMSDPFTKRWHELLLPPLWTTRFSFHVSDYWKSGKRDRRRLRE